MAQRSARELGADGARRSAHSAKQSRRKLTHRPHAARASAAANRSSAPTRRCSYHGHDQGDPPLNWTLSAAQDFTKGGPRYEVILDNVASHSLSETRRALTPDGVLLPSSGHAGMGWVIAAALSAIFIRQQGSPFVATTNSESLLALNELIEAGEVTPVIDRTYPLADAPEPFRYLDEGHARGKVVVAVERDSA